MSRRIHKVAAGRLVRSAVSHAVELYRGIYERVKTNSAGNPVVSRGTGDLVMVSCREEIKNALTDAYKSYLAASPSVQKVEPAELRAYIIDHGPTAAAEYLTRMPGLLRAVQGIGLTEYEFGRSRMTLIKSVKPDAMGDWTLLYNTVMAEHKN